MLGSVNTVKTYIDYLENSWILFTINVYSPSLKQQQIAPKKIYCIDNGFVHHLAFRTSQDIGWFLENTVLLHLRRHTSEIFYAKNDDGSEVDFLVRRGLKPNQLIQVAASLSRAETRKRETNSLWKAMDQYKINNGTIITLDEEGVLENKKRRIRIVPAAKWLLASGESTLE